MPRMQYRLRTLLILLAVGPPLITGAWMVWRHHRTVALQLHIEQLEAEYAEAQARHQEILSERERLIAATERVEAELARVRPEKERRKLPPRQKEAEPGVYFLGPELAIPR